MKGAIHIFKSTKEQEKHHLKLMKESNVEDRFRRLLQNATVFAVITSF